MVSDTRNEYLPEWVTHPGATIQDLLDERGMTQVKLAERTGRPTKTINEIINGKASITPETAIQLERVLRVPASFWINRQRIYDESLAKQEAKKELQKHISWLKSFRVQDIVDLGWIQAFESKSDQLDALFKFFGVNTPEQWKNIWRSPKAVYRQSPAFERDPYATSVWLRKGELKAEEIACQPYVKSVFQSTLKNLRLLTNEPPDVFESEIKQSCAQVGVAVVFVKAFPGVPLTGATRWLTPHKALIQLSLRGKWEDIMWFSFFHEAGHILLHGKTKMFIEGGEEKDERETEADVFARDLLIKPRTWEQFISSCQYKLKKVVIDFAHNQRISPAIVVGRLQHEGYMPPDWMNGLRRRYKFKLQSN